MQRPNGAAKARPPPAGGNALVTFDAQLAKQQEEAQLAKERPKPRNDYLDCYTGPKVKWEDTGLYKALVKSQDIEEELTKIRNLIRKRTDPGYDPDDEEDFKVAPVRKFDSKADYYKLLDVDDFASVKDIKGAYKKLALQYHPDKNRDKKPDKLREMQDEFEKIQEAYEILSDRATRRQYDRARFDEARAKSQGMNSSFYSQKTNTDSSFWGRWGGAAEGKDSGKAKLPTKAAKLPKAADLRLEVKISLEKALRGGLKIREVKRDRMQRAFGGTSQTLKTVNIQIDPGQADGSEYRLPGDGHWPSFNVSPGDLVVCFRHKAHAFLRQAEGGRDRGALQLAVPLQARAKATQASLAVWSPTFKGSMVLLRFRNPLLDLAPSKACNITFILEGEGLPIPNTPLKRGPLAVTVHVQLDGPALVPSFNSSCCKETLLRRHVKHYNHQGTLRVTLANARAAGLPVRKYVAGEARERAGAKVPFPCVVTVWESSKDTDLVAFAQAAAALGHHAMENPQGYGWCCSVQLLPRALPYAHSALSDAELTEDVVVPRASPRASPTKATLTEVQEFLLRFDLGPPEGFYDGPQPPEEVTATTGAPGQSTAEVTVDLQEAEGEEEKELTRLIREKQSDLDQVKRQWVERRERLSGERQEEEGQLRELLEKDKKRELERVEREMNGLRSNFEFQLQAEKKWVDEFMQNNNYQNQWVCVFKPAMVVRSKPQEDGPIARRIMFDEVVRAKTWKVTEDHWIQLETDEWALTWHKVHGQLLQRWFNAEQHRFRELQAKIDERRKVRNETFVAYRRKKKEIEEWSIPPGPSQEEKCEIEDEECEQLHFLMEPIVKELKGYKRRLRELRQKRVEAAVERQRKVDGFLSNAPLPKGFEESLEVPEEQAVPNPEVEKRPWEETKQAADKAFKDKDWNTALSLYSKALESEELEVLQRATLLSNRALCYNRLFEWNKSLEDAVDATVLEPEWPKGWLRRATAELRLAKTREALSSLKRGFSCAGKTAGQFLALTTECEAALYNDKLDEVGVPGDAVGRIAKFKEDGDGAFKQSNYGVAVLCYTRALYHRSMMESKEEAVVLSNRSASFLKLDLANEALADALAASEKDPIWSKPLVRAGQAALQLDDFKAAYQNFAKARRLDEHYEAANDGVQSCLQKIIRWEYSAAARRWSRFAQDRQRPREGLRVWALSDVFFDQHGVPEWCKSLSSSFFRDDVLMLAGNLADSLPQLRFALTVLKSKFRRIFYVPGNHDLWVRRVTLSSIMKGEQVKDERDMGDSISKLLEVQVLGKRSGESSQIQSLAQRWEQRLQRMKDSAVSLFYDGPGTGTVRAIATLKDVHVDAAKNASNAYNAENFVLWDPFEGEMIVVFLDIFGNWSNYTDSQAEKDKIWSIKQQHVAAVEFKTTDKTYVIQQGFWFSSHEQWKILQLPYLEIPLVRQLFTNGELARLTFSNEQQLNGLLASVNAPIGFQCDSAQGKYCSALGIQSLAEQPIWTDSVLTPYGAFPSILIDPAAGLAWYHQMLRMPRAQTALGSIESFTQNGQEVAPIVTWDAKATSVLAMLGGTGQLVRDHLQQSAKMDNFVNRVQSMYAQIFEPSERTGELGGSGSNTVLPMPSEKALPSDPAAPYAKCGCPCS